MSHKGLVLAAHGSRTDSAVNQRINDLAASIEARGRFDEVRAAFHQGSPTFAEVLDQMTATAVRVVPVMTSEGYYSDVVVPRELACNKRFEKIRVSMIRPVGCHPAMNELVTQCAQDLCDDETFSPSETCLMLIGHGTSRHAKSRVATQDVAEEVAAKRIFGQVQACFLDDEPSIEGSYGEVALRHVVALPFMIGGGSHTMRDIPQRLGLTIEDESAPPLRGILGERKIVCGVPIGWHPRIENMIIELASTRPVEVAR
jgi:sirohydrochlorin cobaltochelatase